jgi:hypothetical protein
MALHRDIHTGDEFVTAATAAMNPALVRKFFRSRIDHRQQSRFKNKKKPRLTEPTGVLVSPKGTVAAPSVSDRRRYGIASSTRMAQIVLLHVFMGARTLPAFGRLSSISADTAS